MRHPFGCARALFVAFCAVVFLGVLLELAGVIGVALAIAVLIVVLNRIAVAVRYATKYGKPTKEDKCSR